MNIRTNVDSRVRLCYSEGDNQDIDSEIKGRWSLIYSAIEMAAIIIAIDIMITGHKRIKHHHHHYYNYNY